jgi:carbon monoxide dehydrogenase subunit G
MELTNTRLVAAPLSRVWDALNDPATLKACIPGCERFEPDGDDAWSATVATKIGPVSARFNGRVEVLDVVAPTGYTLRFAGQGGAAGFASGEAKVSLAPAEGGTSLSYAASAQVGGKIAQIGSRLVDGAAAKLADDFVARLAAQLAPPAGEPGAPPAEPEAAMPTPGQTWVRYAAIAAIIVLLAWLAAKGGLRF